MQTSDLNALLPEASKPGPVIKYGTVSQASPLKVIIDGDTTTTDVNAACTPLVGQRVVMVLQDRILTAVAVLEADTGWLTAGHSVAAGWEVPTMRYRRIGKLVQVYFTFNRTGADIVIAANGNMTNMLIATLPVGFRPSGQSVLSSGASGWICAGYADVGGTLNLSAVTYDQDITVGTTTLSLGGTYFVD